MPSGSVATTRVGAGSSRPRPCTTRTPSLLEPALDVGGLVGGELLDPGVDPGQVDPDRRRGVALVVEKSRRARRRRRRSVITSAVAIRVLLGTQSVSTAEPPTPSVSTTVTSAPSWAAT